ncbi:MAG: serine/threonine protein kinase [Myxococcales bacterium]|nr:serine/threonine protein kinase [Myxococcales bacterium]MCB9702687.1 serine/threonine protein kinase [Myxococcales bacterium]
MPTLVGTRLDKYEIQSEVGHGGMAVVYRGRDTVLQREVAIKVLHPHLADREESRLRLRREALTVAKLRHENILEIFDYSGEDATESYLVTEFIHGMTLRQWLDERWRPHPILAALLIHRLCVALAHAHRSDVVHRDIKPENVMIRSDGCLKLMDFGIAQIIDHQKLTMTGQLLGSPAYMAPELISGRPLDARTDLFAVGIMLYQLSTGMLPFSGRNPHEVLSRIADAVYPPAASICSLVDDELEAIIAKSLARDPDQRFQSAEAFAAELEGYLGEAGVPATQDEVMAYFQDHEGYAAALNGRVCAALMERASAAIRDHQSARAIRLLGRALELEPENREARSLLGRLRTRERRIRAMVIGASALAGFGLVAAGVVLALSMPDPPAERAADTRPGEVAAPLVGGGKPIKGAVDPPTDEKKGKPIRTTDAGAATEAAPATTQGSEPAETAGATAPTPTKKLSTRPPKGNPPASKEASCTLTISGIPRAVAATYNLKYAGKTERLDSLEHPIAFSDAQVTVNLTGSRYFGYRSISREECRPGAKIALQAKRKPALLRFRGAPPNTTAECVSGPPCPDAKPHLIVEGASFPQIPMDQDQLYIQLRFKSSGYAPKVDKVSIQPGDNQIDVDLKSHSE